MSLLCSGRVAIVTGAGRGIGREHALLLAKHGAKVVVNDLGSSGDGVGSDETPAQEVVRTIKAAGGEAVVNTDNLRRLPRRQTDGRPGDRDLRRRSTCW